MRDGIYLKEVSRNMSVFCYSNVIFVFQDVPKQYAVREPNVNGGT